MTSRRFRRPDGQQEQQENADEALARALQLQFEREAAASSSASNSNNPNNPQVVSDEEIARRVQEQEQQLYRQRQQQRSSSSSRRQPPPRTSSAGSSGAAAVAVQAEHAPDDAAVARRLAAEQEQSAQAAAQAAVASSSSNRPWRSKRSTTNSGGFVFPRETSNRIEEEEDAPEPLNASGGYVFPVPTASESMTDDTEEEAPPASEVLRDEITSSELFTDRQVAQRVEQEMQDELVAERLQQREQERYNQRRAAQLQADQRLANQQQLQQQRQRAPVNPRKKLYGSLITIALVVGAVVGIVYYFVILGGGVPSINLTPEDFANEDPFDEMNPEDANSWANSGNGISLTVINALETKWYQYFYDALDDWDSGYPDTLTLRTEFHGTAGGASHDVACATVSGKVKVCNGNYPNTRWKGINEVLILNGHIVASSARMNEFYINDDDDQMQHTMCHELGHAWGLPHTDETFGNPDLGDCMDYTNNPENNRKPKARNFIFLWHLYGTVPGAEPYYPPTEAPTPSPVTVVTEQLPKGSNRRRRERQRQRKLRQALQDDKRRQEVQQDDKQEEVPDLPEWLTAAVDSVFHRPAGRRLSQDSWRVLESHELGEAHEIDLPHDWTLRVHYLKATAQDQARAAQQWSVSESDAGAQP